MTTSRCGGYAAFSWIQTDGRWQTENTFWKKNKQTIVQRQKTKHAGWYVSLGVLYCFLLLVWGSCITSGGKSYLSGWQKVNFWWQWSVPLQLYFLLALSNFTILLLSTKIVISSLPDVSHLPAHVTLMTTTQPTHTWPLAELCYCTTKATKFQSLFLFFSACSLLGFVCLHWLLHCCKLLR